jgi:DNA-binding MarR family transcriptional regulator
MSARDDAGDGLRALIDVDRVVHEPARLVVLALLSAARGADFLYLLRETGMTRGNLSSHMSRLEQAGYVAVEKKFVDKIPRTLYRITDDGRAAFAEYRRSVIEALG